MPTDNFSCFASHLDTLRTHPHSPKVNVSLYVTAASSQPTKSAESRHDSDSDTNGPLTPLTPMTPMTPITPVTPVNPVHHNEPEKAAGQRLALHPTSRSASSGYSLSSYGGATTTTPGSIRVGRPETEALIREAVAGMPAGARVLVAACGPAGLVRTARNTTASLIRGDGPAVEFHCEEFGW